MGANLASTHQKTKKKLSKMQDIINEDSDSIIAGSV